MNYLKDGNCSISNNLAENSIRPFTIGRKNWLFSGSPKGASASATVYSIIESAKANGLNPFKYLQFIFSELPGEQFGEHPEFLEDYLPWSPEVQEACKKEQNLSLLEILLFFYPPSYLTLTAKSLEVLL